MTFGIALVAEGLVEVMVTGELDAAGGVGVVVRAIDGVVVAVDEPLLLAVVSGDDARWSSSRFSVPLFWRQTSGDRHATERKKNALTTEAQRR